MRGVHEIPEGISVSGWVDIGGTGIVSLPASMAGAARKTPEQVVEIAGAILEREKHLLVTRVTPEHAGKLTARFENAQDSTRPNVLGVHGGDQCTGT